MRTLFLIIGLISPAFGAQRTDAVTVEQIAAVSTGLVQGEVTAAVTRDVDWEIRTTYSIRVDRVLLGTAPGNLTIDLPGGHYRGSTASVTGVPVWVPGDRVVVFVTENTRAYLHGAFTVRDGRVQDAERRPVDGVPPTIEAFTARAATALRPTPR